MGKVFSITKSVDMDECMSNLIFGRINREIDKYMFETGEENPYLFMNKATIAEIIHTIEIPYMRDFIDYKVKSEGVIGEYHGYKIYANNDLRFGEVEIR